MIIPCLNSMKFLSFYVSLENLSGIFANAPKVAEFVLNTSNLGGLFVDEFLVNIPKQ